MIHQVGAGAVGGYLASCLAKAGNSITVWDGDTVERKNIHNQCFTPKYIGVNKAKALNDMYPNIHTIPTYWREEDIEVLESDFIIMSADCMNTRRKLAAMFHNKMCFDVRLIESTYTIYACIGSELESSLNYDDDDAEIVGLTPPCHMPSCRADLVLAAVAHQFRNIQHFINEGTPAFTYSIGNVDLGFHYEEAN